MQTITEVGNNALDVVLAQEDQGSKRDMRDLWLTQDIEDLDLPQDVLHCLGQNEVRTIGDVAGMAEESLMNKLAQCKTARSDKCLTYIKELLSVKGLTICMRLPNHISGHISS